VLKGGGSEEYSLPRRGHPCPCSPLLLLSPPPGGQRLFSRSPPRFLYAELKQPHVEACWREAALRHGYRAATPPRGKDRNLLFVREEAPVVPAGPLGPYSNSCCGWTPESRLMPCNFACTAANAHFGAAKHRREPVASRTAASGG